jgi:hypothetical protein
MIAIAVFISVKRARERVLKLLNAEEENKKNALDRIEKSCLATKTCMVNVCFIQYETFKAYKQLVPHEKTREDGNLISLDTYEDVFSWVSSHSTMFVSHQWLGFTEPDPDNIHFPAICNACETVCEQFELPTDKLFVWVDYISIPQRNTFLKGLSISSLAVYASVVRFFVIIAPPCMHHDKQESCNSDTYQRRGWCRLEQWARMTIGGLHDMYIHEGGQLVKIEDKPNWYLQSIKVFQGDFTVEADKYKLVDTVMGLWYVALLNESHADNSLLKKLVQENKDEVFPSLYFENYIELLEGVAEQKQQKMEDDAKPHHYEMIRAHSFSSSLGVRTPETSTKTALAEIAEENGENGDNGTCSI